MDKREKKDRENKFVQLELFETCCLKSLQLISDSPQKAFYRIWLRKEPSCLLRVEKESGSKNKVLNRREWTFDDFEKDETFFHKKVQEKTRPGRKGRDYTLCTET